MIIYIELEIYFWYYAIIIIHYIIFSYITLLDTQKPYANTLNEILFKFSEI